MVKKLLLIFLFGFHLTNVVLAQETAQSKEVSLDTVDIDKYKLDSMYQAYKLIKQKHEIEMLKKNEELQSHIIVKKSYQVTLLGISIVFLMLMIFFFIKQSRKKELNNKILDQKNKLLETQRKILEEKQYYLDQKNAELQSVNDALKEKSEEKSAIVRVVAHDLKSPLGNIMGLVDLIALNSSIDEESKGYVDLIKKIIEDTDDLIQKMLDISAIESGRANFERKEFDLNELVESAVEQFQQSANQKRITLKVFRSNEGLDGRIHSDPSYIRQVINNLISNAIKFSPFDTQVCVCLDRHDSSFTVSVKDEGPGISEEEQKQLFKKFTKLSNQPTNQEKSTGLGLSIVKAILEKLDGEIEVESIVGKGSSFTIKLPL
ncbi:sensor histidine kinase [Aureibacter tunicatorum]|uniref:histidine kinase n=1 Tax=Aureibacter tunicatorum TaxID=866807 RepID=A0AAE3XK38_9BACT|nr:HAMP domain-containing sensor histidine kinase [Aureibacter tunicatorum]MDR6237241.1 signal transduction histidine kinase [Aureibacter tunicatorum]BDD06233.1 hypothetical protein AUTU_37160 [Aureibacter tunicatorum]